MYKIDLTGQRFGKLTVIEYSHTNDRRKTFWKCRCDCGNEKTVAGYNLRSGNTSSCGCGERENREQLMSRFYNDHYKHGKCYDRIHTVWAHMKERCSNPNTKDFALYGGRGICVCPEWAGEDGFQNFFDWSMKNGYRDDLTIDRINVNGNYEPSNCRWASATQQANNRRSSRLISIDGETKTLAEWCKQYGMNYYSVYYRIEKGCDPKIALTTKGRIKNL